MKNSYEQSTVENELKLSNKDAMGFDPFGLRIIRKLHNGLSLPDLITHYKYDHPDSKQYTYNPTLLNEASSEQVPLYVHLIWFGSAFDKPKFRERALAWRKFASNYQLILWTDQEDRKSEKNIEMYNWCQENNIKLINIKDVLSTAIPLAAHLINELNRGNWAGASDIWRWFLPGIYTDVDVYPKADIGYFTIQNEDGVLVNCQPRTYENLQNKKTSDPNNDLLASLPNAPGQLKFQNKILENYKKSASQTMKVVTIPQGFGETHTDYNECYFKLTKELFYKFRTINLTGPANLNIFNLHDMRHGISPKDFTLFNEGNWYKNISGESSNITLVSYETTINALKHVLTNILHDLNWESRVFRLSDYNYYLNKFDILDNILYLLHKYYSDTLRNVEFIRVDGLELTSYAFKLLSDKVIFPSVKENGFLGVNSLRASYEILKKISSGDVSLISENIILTFCKNPVHSKQILNDLLSDLGPQPIAQELVNKIFNGACEEGMAELVHHMIQNIPLMMSNIDCDKLHKIFILDNMSSGYSLEHFELDCLILKHKVNLPQHRNSLLTHFTLKIATVDKELRPTLIRGIKKFGITKESIFVSSLSVYDYLDFSYDFFVDYSISPFIRIRNESLLINICKNDKIHFQFICHLLEKGLDSNEKDKSGNTAMYYLFQHADQLKRNVEYRKANSLPIFEEHLKNMKVDILIIEKFIKAGYRLDNLD